MLLQNKVLLTLHLTTRLRVSIELNQRLIVWKR